MQIAIDTGGTFTDCVYLDNGELKVLKIFSTTHDPAAAVVAAIGHAARGKLTAVRHGTTVGTNALLERKGARVAFVTTQGFEDTIAIGRQTRANLYDWFYTPEPSLVPPELRFGVPERTAWDGTQLKMPSPSELESLSERIAGSGVQSIAVSLLFSFSNPANEQAVAKVLERLELPLSLSHIIHPEFREYERASTVVINAYLAPLVGKYLRGLQSELARKWPGANFEVMQSSGGIVPASFAADQPVRTVLSGPAGGVMGAYFVAQQAGFSKIIAFDMGGTSTDVSLIDAAEGGPRSTHEALISGLPVSVPVLDIHTVGAGGGSLARFDAAGILHVGPQSAGANPGPICYGRGTEPAVSDANLILGRLHPHHFLGGTSPLGLERTREYMNRHRGSMPTPTPEAFAEGIVLLAEAAMEKAIRVISVEKGYDPRDFTLVAFGGAGPLHACALARQLRIPRVLIPSMPGALSALGILLSDTVRDYSRTVMLPASADLESPFSELETRARDSLDTHNRQAVFTRSVDLRYKGQGYELNVASGPDLIDRFHQAHQRRYGYFDPSRQVEVVSLRLRLTIPADPVVFPIDASRPGDGTAARIEERPVIFDGAPHSSRVLNRDLLRAGDRFSGPAIIVEYSATTVVPPPCVVNVDTYRNLVIEMNES